jgi:hypothetical protein
VIEGGAAEARIVAEADVVGRESSGDPGAIHRAGPRDCVGPTDRQTSRMLLDCRAAGPHLYSGTSAGECERVPDLGTADYIPSAIYGSWS